MENQPKFIKEFSKQSPEERQKAAQAIKAKRAETAAEKRARAENAGKIPDERAERLAKQEKALRALEQRLDELTTLGLDKIEEEFETNRIRADIALGKKTYEELKQEMESGTVEATNKPGADGPARELLKQFYAEQKEKWANSEFTQEDLKEYLSEENLAKLSLEDYIALMRRFPNEMVTHVTRQGVRDHTGHTFHNAGENQFLDGFKSIVRDGRLRSALGIKMVEGMKEDTVAKYLNLGRFKSRQEAVDFLHSMTRPKEAPGSFADVSSIHFAAEEVADAYYGSEKGNEIFFAYPSAHVASQYHFSGRLDQAGGGYWNDQWVWANEERGMAIDAGLVFIPEGARVDPQTGSRYKLDAETKPVKNVEVAEAIRRFVDAPGFQKFAEEVTNEIGSLSSGFERVFKKYRPRLKDEFGLADERIQSAVLDYDLLRALSRHKENLAEGKGDAEEEDGNIVQQIDGSLKNAGVYFQEAESTVSSKEYWDRYFSENPDKRPSKIIYYKGQSPTAALHAWREENGLIKTTAETGVGLDEGKVGVKSAEANLCVERFESLAMEVIDKHFGAEPPPDLEDIPPPDDEEPPPDLDEPPPDEDEPPPDVEEVPPTENSRPRTADPRVGLLG